MDFARDLWLRLETINAVTYFDEGSHAAAKACGATGFWMGYFGFRAAPMGSVGAGVVEATFFNFAPGFVQRWVPSVWSHASPEQFLEARGRSAAGALRRLAPGIETVAREVNATLESAVAQAVAAGRPLYAANRLVPRADDPVARLWQLCTTLREHRGDGHVAALTTEGVDGCQAHVLIALDHGTSPEDLQRTRGWTEDDWALAIQRCIDRGWVGRDGALTPAGGDLRRRVETTTDRLAAEPFEALGRAQRAGILGALEPAARAVSASGTIRYPNPMGLPALA